MPTNPSVIELSALDGSNGFQINGVAAGDQSGFSVASAGDVNGDGFADLIVGAYGTDPNGDRSGASYVVFGKASGFASSLDLSALNGSDGFQINGEAADDRSGRSVASAGDVNGDGFADLIVGAHGADPNGSQSGASYVVFGKASGFASNLELSALDGSNGFQINGEVAGDNSGLSVSGAGDVNGDGFDDLIVGAHSADPNGDYSGASYVVFGKASGFASNLELSALDGANGFQINGEAADDRSGRSVAGAGDVNGDGFADLIVGAYYGADPNGTESGATYVVFGKASGFASSLELSALDGSNGFQINGEAADDRSGISVASAGDVNGDGFSDLIVGAYFADPNGSYSGASYVVFGKASGFASSLELSALDGSNGFRLDGAAAYDYSGVSVASAGDVNGDGFADLIVGAFAADPNGSLSGSSYVVFGQASSFTANLELSALDGSDGFQINGEATDDRSGWSIASAGDVNNDGFADLIVGARLADPNGLSSGASYVIYGRATDSLNRVGTDDDDRLFGGDFDDTLSGLGGNDTLIGGLGADSLEGGADTDTADYSASASAVTVNLGTGVHSGGDAAGDTLAGIENIIGSAGNDMLTGNGKANRLFGEDGNDTLNGRFGDDTVRGGNGNDLLDGGAGNDFVFSGFDNDTINASAGNDTIDGSLGTNLLDVSVNFSGAAVVDLAAGTASFFGGHTALISNVEWVLGTIAADSLTGDGAANRLTGGNGNDTLIGAGGNDTLIGGAGADSLDSGNGKDTADYSASAGAVTVNLATGAVSGGDADGDTLTSIENVIGSAGGDSLRGNAAANSLIGNGGNDHLSGAWGNDTLFSGFGRDTLIGGAGADDLHGGAGSDTADYSASGAAVSVNLLTGAGSSGDAAGDTLTGIENVIGSAGDDSLTGDNGANRLTGGNGRDTLTGGSGNDTLTGGDGNDALTGGDDDDRLSGGSGNDNLEGKSGDDDLFGQSGNDWLVGWGGNDRLMGGSGDDTLNGGDDNDTLVGGAGFDVLRGGSGNDVFDFNWLSETKTGALRDRIPDFTQGDDVIDLAGIDADTTHAGNDAFHFIGSTPFGGQAGELRQFILGANTIIEGDVNGDGNADFQIALTTASLTLTDGDFVL